MKKCILSALLGSAVMFLILAFVANVQAAEGIEFKENEHIDYVSNVTEGDCYICGDNVDTVALVYWGESL